MPVSSPKPLFFLSVDHLCRRAQFVRFVAYVLHKVGFLYKLVRIMGDVSAVKPGRVGRRMVRRAAGCTTGRTLRKLFK